VLLSLILAATVVIVLVGVGLAMPRLLIDVIGHLLAGRPDDVEGWCYYGTLLDRAGDQGAAAEAYKTALKLKPDYIDCWRKLASVLERMGDFDGAAEAYELGR
jgi:cytochrome c-type biogenesis protein CcmH/NrfG